MLLTFALVDVNSLTTPQLAEVQKQLQQEIDHFTGSFQQLQQAQLKFNECGETVKITSKPENEGIATTRLEEEPISNTHGRQRYSCSSNELPLRSWKDCQL